MKLTKTPSPVNANSTKVNTAATQKGSISTLVAAAIAQAAAPTVPTKPGIQNLIRYIAIADDTDIAIIEAIVIDDARTA
ncbi:hypothetical protein QCD71_16160 [Sphingomonas sp. PsM26]|nr:hypothetical protein [Sphingomonas sp. PsM26]